MVKLILFAAAFASFLLSVYLYFVADDKTAGIFVEIWVPSIARGAAPRRRTGCSMSQTVLLELGTTMASSL